MDARELANGASEEEDESFLLIYLCLFGSFLYLLWLRRDRADYRRIPSAGFSGTLTSFLSALKFFYHPTRVLEEGYLKFSNGIFRFPTFTQWIVVVAKPKYVEELRKVPEDELSASAAMEEILQLPFTVNSELISHSQLKSLLGAQLTRNLHELLPEIHAEALESVNELVQSEEDEWKYIDELKLMTSICTRVINRVLVGPVLCRNPEFMELCALAVNNLERHAKRVRLCPPPFRPFFAFLFTPFPRIKRRMRTLLTRILKDRQELLVKHGLSFPNDMITWFTDYDTDSEIPTDELVAHILLVNYLSVRPMVKIMSQALRNLAKYRNHVKVLRTEVAGLTRQDGWSKPAIDKMHNVDSFLKEVMRLDETALTDSLPNLTMGRKSLRPLTFSDGITIPTNTLVFVGSQLIHTEKQNYTEPNTFNPFRFIPDPEIESRPPRISPAISSESRLLPSSAPSVPLPPDSPSSSIASVPVSSTLPATSPTFLAWGHGKHACPGRFFAASVMKLLLAHFVLEFDFRLPPISDSIPAPNRAEEKGDDVRGENQPERILWIEVQRRRRQPKS